MADLAPSRRSSAVALLEGHPARDPRQLVRPVRRRGRKLGKALVGIAGSGLLAPGGIALQLLIVAACAVAYARRRRALLAGVAVLAGAVVLFVVLELVWLRYFVPMSVAAAAGLGAALGALRGGAAAASS